MALCPHCQHALPEPHGPLCPNCGGDLLAPGPGAAREAPPELPAAGRGGIAWDRRDGTGILAALVETTREVLARPGAFFRAMPVTGGLGSPLLYAVLIGWIGLAAAAFYQAVFRSVVGTSGSLLGDRPELAALLGWVESWAGFLAQVIFGGVFVVIGVFVAAGILHVMLLLLGGARRGFEATFRVVSFAQATSILFLIPFCGQAIGAVWGLVLYVIGLAGAHRIGHGRAAAAVLLPLALLCCCCVGLALAFAGAIAGLAGQMR
jgi:hypothetical protein